MELLQLFQQLGVSLAIGFLVGVERGWRSRFSEDESRAAGLRTYSLIGLLGGVAGVLAHEIGAAAFVVIATIFGLIWLSFKLWETFIDGDISATGAVAGLLVFSLGGLAATGQTALAAGAAVVLVAILGFKQAMHAWLRGLTIEELRSALVILAATLIVLPLLPEGALDPYGAFNPRQLWVLTIVIAAATFGAYIALRALGPQTGLYVGAALAALVSSTVATLDLARRAKNKEAGIGHAAAAAVLANVVMFARVGALTAVFAPGALVAAAPALAAACVVSIVAAAWLRWSARRAAVTPTVPRLGSPLDVKAVARFAAILAAVMALSRLALYYSPSAGVMAFAGLAGLADVDAAVLALGDLLDEGVTAAVAGAAILIAVAADTALKVGIGFFVGGSAFGGRYLAASGLAAAAALAVLWPL
jgi:uncharacterized membrane protein (DUF4010 family)